MQTGEGGFLHLEGKDHKKGAHSCYPLIGDKVQAEIIAHARAEARPVPTALLNEALNSSRGKISTEVGWLIEAGLPA